MNLVFSNFYKLYTTEKNMDWSAGCGAVNWALRWAAASFSKTPCTAVWWPRAAMGCGDSDTLLYCKWFEPRSHVIST